MSNELIAASMHRPVPANLEREVLNYISDLKNPRYTRMSFITWLVRF